MQKEDVHIDLDFDVEILNSKSESVSKKEDGEITDDDQPDEPNPPQKPAKHSQIPSPVGWDKKNSPRDIRRACTRTLYVGDLPKTITEDRLYQIFKKYGDIMDIDIKYLRFGVATFAFIQFIDPDASMNAYENEKFLVIDNEPIKIGFGRANIYDTIFISRYDSSDLPVICDKIQSYSGFDWSLTDKNMNQTIIKFDSISDASNAVDMINLFDAPFQNILVSYMSVSSTKKFVSRMYKSGQKVNDKIMREFGLNKSTEKFKDEYSDNNYIDHKNLENDRKRSVSPSEYLNEKSNDLASSTNKIKKYKPTRSESTSNRFSDTKTDSSDSNDLRSHIKGNISSTLLKMTIWKGELSLKRKSVNVSFLFLKGNRRVFDACLCNIKKGEEQIKVLKIEQRMTLDEEQFLIISNRIKNDEDCAFCLAISNKNNDEDLKKYFVEYFAEKNAAGVVNIHDTKKHSLTHVIYFFPFCSLTAKYYKDATIEIQETMEKYSHLFVIALRCQ